MALPNFHTDATLTATAGGGEHIVPPPEPDELAFDPDRLAPCALKALLGADEGVHFVYKTVYWTDSRGLPDPASKFRFPFLPQMSLLSLISFCERELGGPATSTRDEEKEEKEALPRVRLWAHDLPSRCLHDEWALVRAKDLGQSVQDDIPYKCFLVEPMVNGVWVRGRPTHVLAPWAQTEGRILDVRDFRGRWYESEVLTVDTSSNAIFVHYINWESKWDEWVRDPCDVAPRGTFTYGPYRRTQFEPDSKERRPWGVFPRWYYPNEFPEEFARALAVPLRTWKRDHRQAITSPLGHLAGDAVASQSHEGVANDDGTDLGVANADDGEANQGREGPVGDRDAVRGREAIPNGFDETLPIVDAMRDLDIDSLPPVKLERVPSLTTSQRLNLTNFPTKDPDSATYIFQFLKPAQLCLIRATSKTVSECAVRALARLATPLTNFTARANVKLVPLCKNARMFERHDAYALCLREAGLPSKRAPVMLPIRAFSAPAPAMRSLRAEATLEDLATFARHLPKLTHLELLLSKKRRSIDAARNGGERRSIDAAHNGGGNRSPDAARNDGGNWLLDAARYRCSAGLRSSQHSGHASLFNPYLQPAHPPVSQHTGNAALEAESTSSTRRPQLSFVDFSSALTSLKIQRASDLVMSLSLDECKEFSRLERLEEVDLLEFEIDSDAMGVLLRSLPCGLRSFSHIMIEEEGRTHRSAALDHVELVAQRFAKLEMFDVCYDSESKTIDVINVLETLPHLTALQGSNMASEFLQAPTARHVTSLSLAKLANVAPLQSLLKRYLNLEEVDLEVNDDVAERMLPLAVFALKRLRVLTLSNFMIERSMFDGFSSLKSIEVLRVGFYDFFNNTSVRTWRAFGDALHQTPLERLVIRDADPACLSVCHGVKLEFLALFVPRRKRYAFFWLSKMLREKNFEWKYRPEAYYLGSNVRENANGLIREF